MSRFMKESDYAGRIKDEIKRMVTGTEDPNDVSAKQLLAEETSISTVTEYIGGRYDCDAIFNPPPSGTGADTRNKHMVKIIMALTLYDLYGQTPSKDLPQHRKDNYDDAISWLKDVGRGNINTTLPPVSDTTNPGDFRINSRPPTNQKW